MRAGVCACQVFLTTVWEPHDGEDPVQLVMVVGAAGLHVFLPTVEYGLKGQQLGKYTPYGPNICQGRKRERERKRDRQTHRDRERKTERERQREKDRKRDSGRKTKKERQTDRQKERDRKRKRERERQTDRERDSERERQRQKREMHIN